MATQQQWLEKQGLDSRLFDQLQNASTETLYDSFYTRLEFGTAGMRGLLGPGPNRMNIYTVGRANTGYGKYILSLGVEKPKVAIAYDNRHYSSEFAMVCAQLLAKQGIESYVFETLRPTPELSYAVRHLNCAGGIVITASHNPKEYNGYKVYDETGCQLTPERIEQVIDYVSEIENELDIDFTVTPEQEALIHMISKEIDEPYKKEVLGIQLRKEVLKDNLTIVFTPQHGTAYPLMMEILEEAGYKVHLVEEQAFPDPDFVNTKTPNPEDIASYDKAIELAKEVNADLVLSTDPDADRMGIVVKHKGEYVYLTGNQGGTILLEYILSTRLEKGILPESGRVYNTIVTSDAGEQIAKTYNINTEKTLTGFKFIGTKIKELEESQEGVFLMGYEESYGYLLAPFVRDKDALQSCLMLAEAAAYYQSKDMTLVDVLYSVFDKVGTYLEETVSLTFAGEEGAQRIKQILGDLRQSALTELGGVKVVASEDYLSATRVEDGVETMLDFPSSDVLKYYLEDGSWVAIRPSGTEPKCKFYYCVKAESIELAKEKIENYKQAITTLTN